MLDPLAVRPLVVEPVAVDFVVCEDDVRLTVDLEPEGDTVLMRVLEVPVLLTLLLTVVVGTELLVVWPVLVVCPVLVDDEDVSVAGFAVVAAGFTDDVVAVFAVVAVVLLEVPLTSAVAVLVRVPVWVEVDLVAAVLFWSLSVLLAVRASAVVIVFVWVAACCASRMSRAFTTLVGEELPVCCAEDAEVFTGMLTVRTEKARSGCCCS